MTPLIKAIEKEGYRIFKNGNIRTKDKVTKKYFFNTATGYL